MTENTAAAIRATLDHWNARAPWTPREGRLQDALRAVLDLAEMARRTTWGTVEPEDIYDAIADALGVDAMTEDTTLTQQEQDGLDYP